MAKDRRDITVDPPRYPVVDPDGLIKQVAVASNIRGALELDEGVVVLSRTHQREGWRMLRDLYEEDGRLDLFDLWLKHQAAGRTASGARQKVQPFPEKLLPSEVQRRRKGIRPVNAFELPADVKPIIVEAERADDVKPPDAPKKDAAKK